MDNGFSQNGKKAEISEKLQKIKELQKFLIVLNKKNQNPVNDKPDQTITTKNINYFFESRNYVKSFHSSRPKFRINDSRNINLSRNISNERNNEQKELNFINEKNRMDRENKKLKPTIFDCEPNSKISSPFLNVNFQDEDQDSIFENLSIFQEINKQIALLKLPKIKMDEEREDNQDFNIKYLLSRIKSFLKEQAQRVLKMKFQIFDNEFWKENLQFIFGSLISLKQRMTVKNDFFLLTEFIIKFFAFALDNFLYQKDNLISEIKTMIKNEYEDQVISLTKKAFELEEERERRKKDRSEELESIKLKMTLLIGENENLKEKMEKFLENKKIILNGSIIDDAFDSLENSSASLNRTISKIFKNKFEKDKLVCEGLSNLASLTGKKFYSQKSQTIVNLKKDLNIFSENTIIPNGDNYFYLKNPLSFFFLKNLKQLNFNFQLQNEIEIINLLQNFLKDFHNEKKNTNFPFCFGLLENIFKKYDDYYAVSIKISEVIDFLLHYEKNASFSEFYKRIFEISPHERISQSTSYYLIYFKDEIFQLIGSTGQPNCPQRLDVSIEKVLDMVSKRFLGYKFHDFLNVLLHDKLLYYKFQKTSYEENKDFPLVEFLNELMIASSCTNLISTLKQLEIDLENLEKEHSEKVSLERFTSLLKLKYSYRFKKKNFLLPFLQENKIDTSLLVKKYKCLLESRLDSAYIEYYELLQIFMDALQKIEKEEKNKRISILRENYKKKILFSFRAFHSCYEEKEIFPTNLFFFLHSEPIGSLYALNELCKMRILNKAKSNEEILNLEKIFPENALEQKFSHYLSFCESTNRIVDFPKLPILKNENNDSSLNMRLARQGSLKKIKKKKGITVNFENLKVLEIKKSLTLKDSHKKRKDSILEEEA